MINEYTWLLIRILTNLLMLTTLAKTFNLMICSFHSLCHTLVFVDISIYCISCLIYVQENHLFRGIYAKMIHLWPGMKYLFWSSDDWNSSCAIFKVFLWALPYTVYSVRWATFFLINRVENQKLNQTTAELPFGWVFGFQLGLRQTQ